MPEEAGMPDLMTTKQVAAYLQLSERSIYRLLERGAVPAVKVGGVWRFRKSAVDEWLDVRLGTLETGELDRLGDELRASTVSLSGQLAPANVLLDVEGGSRSEVLRSVTERLVLPEPVDRAELLARLGEREDLCTTALPDGVAVPHTARSEDRLMKRHDVVAFGRTVEPVPFGALDGGRTDLLFLVLARDERSHLLLLAKVTRLVRDDDLLAVLRTSDDPVRIIQRIRNAERSLFRQPEPVG
jgi:PTS system nitrogen regulatory IIA component